MERIVLDTTALYADPNRRRIVWRVLEALVEDGDIEVIIPEVVIREMVHHRRKALAAPKEDLEKLKKQLSGFNIQVYWPDINEDAVIAAYERDLRDAAAVMGTVDPVPQADHDELVQRAVRKLKPFAQTSGAGYRDALIWESVMAAAKEGPVTFVTDNHKDFCTSAELVNAYRELHPDLVEQLDVRSIDTSAVRVGTLDAVVAQFVEHPRVWLRERAGDDDNRLLEAVEDRFNDVIRDAVAKHLGDIWLDQGIEIMTTHNTDDVLLEEIKYIGGYYVDEANFEPPDRLIGAVTVSAEIVVAFSVEVWFDGEWMPLDRYVRPTSVELRVNVEINETTDQLSVTSIEGPFGGYIDLNE